MITQYTSALIPDSVVDGRFPKADEDRLVALGTQWRSLDTEMTTESSAVTAESRTVFANWTGRGADTAYGQVTAVTKFASSVSTAGATIAKGCTLAASFVANTKAGINVVLVHLDNLTKEQILIGLASPLLIPVCLQRILNLRTRAKTLISAYSEALIAAMARIPFSVAIQPRPSGGGGSTSSATSASGAVDVSTTPSPSTPGSRSTGGTASAGGKATTTGVTPAATSGVSAGSTTDSPASVVAGWTGGLAAFQIADVASAIAKAPQVKDPAASPDAATKPSGTDPAATDASGTPGHASPAGSNPTGIAPAAAPTDGSGLMTDKSSLYTDMGQAAPQTTTPDATTTAPPRDGALQPKLVQSITNQVVGTGSGHEVARSLDHVSSWTNPGPNHDTPLTVQPPPSAPAAVTPPTGQAGVPHGGAGTTTGGQQNWTTAHPAGVGNPAAAPVSAPTPPPVGTVAAGGDTSGAPVAHEMAPAPIAPVVPVTNTTTVFQGSPGGAPNIQIAPGTAMAPPTTGFAGAPAGGSPFTATTNVPPVGNLSAPVAALQPTSAVPATSVPAPAPAAAPPAQSAPHAEVGAPANAAQPLRIDTTRGAAPAALGGAGADAVVVTVATAIAALGLVGAAAQHFTGLWRDLGSTTQLRPTGTLLPTQFGHDNEILAAMPMGMETVYQKVLLPGEADQIIGGQIETLRGLVYPYRAVRELRTPCELYDVLGLGFAVSGTAGTDTLAFDRDAESVEVVRCAGLRLDDLVTPIDSDVTLPAGTVPSPLVRHHRRPWTGTGEAPGSTSENIIEEHEVLGHGSVGIPHLAEIWRLHADGSEEYVSTYNARNGQWVGDTSSRQAQVGRRVDNGAYAGLGDGTVFRTTVLTDAESVLIAYGVSAPEHFEQVHDGSRRSTVSNADIVSVTGVATIGRWRALPIQLLLRQATMLLVDYAGDDQVTAAAAGFRQVNQGQWVPRWVEHAEVTEIQELERQYAPPRAAAEWTGGSPGSNPRPERDRHLAQEAASGAVR